ncbi:MAG TPA: M4 family metallopeptidase, partial [Vicinamibacteria bacterium]|nr:M4 family metallopeptidase [Vicinamibacteria bacterium]
MPSRLVLGLVLTAVATPTVGRSQTMKAARTVWATEAAEVPALATEVERMLDAGLLAIARRQRDGHFPRRTHERMNQFHAGVRVFGGQLVWQREGQRVLSITGNLFDDIDIDTTPSLTADDAARRALEGAAGDTRLVGGPELVILPLQERYVLAYSLHLRGRTGDGPFGDSVFVDARSGAILLRYSDLHTQSAVGLGIGTWEDEKKLSVEMAAGTNRAVDMLRPFGIKTFDVGFDFLSWNSFMADTDEFLAVDSDNEWEDGAVVDAHANSGFTYDYYFKRHGREGIDDEGLAAINFVHFFPQSFGYNNAFYDSRDNSMNYGDGDEETFNFFSSALDVVAHELTHGVTDFSSELIYLNESGALNEAFSDIMGTSVEFFFEEEGDERQTGDWLVGEDLYYDFGPYIRSMEDPASIGDPDHYSERCLPPVCTPDAEGDWGGVHINSSIVNHAFYLMVEGGTNETSGIEVEGLGMDEMERIESIFYRAFVFYLVPSSNFSQAREATLVAARELYGEGSVEEQTVAAGWDAV